MAVSDRHKDYTKHEFEWARIRDAVAGEDAVKRAQTSHLPKPSGQSDFEYHQYLQRAMFYGASGRTVQGLLGAIFRKPPMVDIPRQLELAVDNITLTGVDLETFAKGVCEEVISMGRYGILVDRSTEAEVNRPYLRGYSCESIINWRTRNVGGVVMLDQVILQEEDEVPASDGFGSEYRLIYRVLLLDDDGYYKVCLYTETQSSAGERGFRVLDEYTPTNRGERLRFIPFQFVSHVGLTPDYEKSPILDLVNVNMSHYRTTADLEQANYLTSQPTPYITNMRSDLMDDYRIGSGSLWLLPEGSQVGMLEYQGAGLTSLETSLNRKESMMALLGARMLEDSRKVGETAETVRLRGSGESSILASISGTVSTALTCCLEWMAAWENIAKAEPVIQLNKDFLDSRLSAQELTALVSAWQMGAMPLDDLLYNLQRGEMLRPDYTIDEFRQILTEGSITEVSGQQMTLDEEQEETDQEAE
jgi:hypothetical protein